jgi:hypothetical protein
MQQAAIISVAVEDNQNGDPATSMLGSVPKASTNQGKEEPTKTWMADIETPSIVINVDGVSFVGSLIDRRLQCTVELPGESTLQTAKTAALMYAEEYVHLHLANASWVLPSSVEWSEFVAIRSSEELQQRITAQRPTIAVSA